MIGIHKPDFSALHDKSIFSVSATSGVNSMHLGHIVLLYKRKLSDNKISKETFKVTIGPHLTPVRKTPKQTCYGKPDR